MFSAHMAPCSHVLCSGPLAHAFFAQGPLLTHSLLRAPCSRLLCSHSPLISCWFHLHLISEPLTSGSKPSKMTWGSTTCPQQVGGESPQTSGMTTELPKSLMYSMLVHSPCTNSYTNTAHPVLPVRTGMINQPQGAEGINGYILSFLFRGCYNASQTLACLLSQGATFTSIFFLVFKNISKALHPETDKLKASRGLPQFCMMWFEILKYYQLNTHMILTHPFYLLKVQEGNVPRLLIAGDDVLLPVHTETAGRRRNRQLL